MMVSLEKLVAMIAEHFGVSPTDVSEDSRFVEDLGADSMDLINLALNLEDRLGIGISDAVLPQIETVGHLYRFYMEYEME